MQRFSRITTLAIPFVAMSFALAAQAQTKPSNTPAQAGDNPDASFVTKAAQGGLAEVELSKVAEKNAKSADVKSFATQMVHDHTANNKELATIAAHENIAVPKSPDSEHVAMCDRLKAMKGADFDRAYVDAMKTDHQKMDDLLKSSQATVTTEELRTFIKKTDPVVEHHLSMAQKLKVE